jgi:hypothetical protein
LCGTVPAGTLSPQAFDDLGVGPMGEHLARDE